MGTATKKTAKDSKKKQVKVKDLIAKKNVKGGTKFGLPDGSLPAPGLVVK